MSFYSARNCALATHTRPCALRSIPVNAPFDALERKISGNGKVRQRRMLRVVDRVWLMLYPLLFYAPHVSLLNTSKITALGVQISFLLLVYKSVQGSSVFSYRCSHLHDTKRLLGAVVSVQTFEETLQGVPRKCIAALRSEGIISPQISPIKRADILLSRKHSAPFGTGKVIHQSFQELNPR